MYYSIFPYKPEAHLYKVRCVINNPSRHGQVLSLPAWIPGSYMLREFSKNIVSIKASSAGRDVKLTKLDKSTWRTDQCESVLEIEYDVYAWDLSVRSAHLDTTHAYFNGTSVFIKVHGKENEPIDLDILPPPDHVGREWKVATSLTLNGAELWGYGRYSAQDYDDLIDHPVEMGDLTVEEFDVSGVPHYIVITGTHKTDLGRLRNDLEEICKYEVAFFGDLPDMDRYLFLVWVVGNGYGGLEHRASCSLICSRSDLPAMGMGEPSDGYKSFLGLCSHEYFHTWNVKKIKPAGFMPYDLTSESYTRQLWAFEGITSYYDDLILVRSGRVSAEEYLSLLAQTATRVWGGKGRFEQSVADSSFDAWTKFYKQDENAPNAIVSYYTKGSLIALALDITIRKVTNDKKSLDNLLAKLWTEYGKVGVGVPEGRIEELASEIAGCSLKEFFAKYLYGTEDLPLEELLSYVGVQFALRPPVSESDKGGLVKTESGQTFFDVGIRSSDDAMGVKVTHVFTGGAAEKCGLASGDVIVAIDNLKTSKSDLEDLLRQCFVGQELVIHAFRRDELMRFTLRIQEPEKNRVVLELKDNVDSITDNRRKSWLNI